MIFRPFISDLPSPHFLVRCLRRTLSPPVDHLFVFHTPQPPFSTTTCSKLCSWFLHSFLFFILSFVSALLPQIIPPLLIFTVPFFFLCLALQSFLTPLAITLLYPLMPSSPPIVIVVKVVQKEVAPPHLSPRVVNI